LSEIANSVQIQRIDGNEQRYAARLIQNSATAQQIGTVQYIEGINCKHLRSNEVTISGSLRSSSGVTVKAVIVQWNSTEDVITNDLISTYGATVTLASNFTKAGTEKSISLTANTWKDFSHTVTLNSSFNNLCVLLYVTSDIGQNTTLDYEKIKVSKGKFATPFVTRDIATELTVCKRYFERQRYDRLAPVQAGVCFNADRIIAPLLYARKRVAPTIAESGQWVGNATAANRGAVTLSFEGMSPISAKMNADKTSEFVAGHGAYIASDLDGSYIDIDAEL
jgi:hypothetical protein